MNIWVFSDTHFYHDNIKKYHNRPDNVEDLMLEAWIKSVKQEDVIIHLGDVTWKKHGTVMDWIAAMPGKKILVRGNHDYHSCQWYMEHGFDFACERFVLFYRMPWEGKKDGHRILFTHEPVPALPKDVELNIHGHLHTKNASHREGEVKPKHFHILVAIEDTGWKPLLLEDVLSEKIRRK